VAHILIIEDDTTIRKTLEFNLRQAGFGVSSAKDGQQGIELATSSKPDLVLLDLMLPRLDGFTVCKQIRQLNPKVSIVMLTALDDENNKLKGFEVGADDYVTKPFSSQELFARIKANLRRQTYFYQENSDKQIRHGDLIINSYAKNVFVSGKSVRLTPKEYLLLLELAYHPGKIYTRPQLAEKVWGYKFLPSSRTIDIHVHRLRTKIEKRSLYNFIHTVPTFGYQFKPVKKLG
jgi:DNA-binding response OmpR family regulator